MIRRRSRPNASRLLLAAVLALSLLSWPASSHASEGSPGVGDRTFDALVLRPLGALGTAVGFGFFVCSLPLAGPTLQLDVAWDTFVGAPFEYTFERGLGEL